MKSFETHAELREFERQRQRGWKRQGWHRRPPPAVAATSPSASQAWPARSSPAELPAAADASTVARCSTGQTLLWPPPPAEVETPTTSKAAVNQ
mmetsp:Transcript_81840/g.252770  ORF Transcript_81840/g.252770 Transcript_81840/m.252770 type:complete len:94 (+) Transcript_81840:2250-2531(+)